MEPRTRNSDEIDLLYFFNPLFKGLKKTKLAFGRYLNVLKRNVFLFLAIFLVLAGSSYALRFILPKLYSTNAIFVSYNLPPGFYPEVINNMKELLKKGNASILSDQLKISPQAAATVKSISTVKMDSVMLFDNNDSTTQAFKVRLVVTDPNSITEVQKGLEAFLENNEFALKRREAKRKTMEALRSDLIVRIESLDSLKEILSKSVVPRGNGQGIILGEPVSPIQAFQVQREYFSQLKDIEERLSLLRNVDIVQPFTKINEPNAPNFEKMFLYGLALGLIAALLLTPFLGKR